MRIAFTANHKRTLIFAEAAKHLQTLGHEVYWITSGSKSVSSVLAPFNKVLDLSKRIAGDLAGFENYSEITVKGIIASDRILRKLPYEDALVYAGSCRSLIKQFLSANSIDIVFSEATWAHELITAGACREVGSEFLSPVNVRYPSDRFAFFKGVFQKEYVSVSNGVNISEGRNLYNDFLQNGSRPFYMNPVRKNLLRQIFFHLFRHVTGDTKDLTVPSFTSLTVEKLAKVCTAGRKVSCLPSGEYIYLPLQCTPESSVDVQAGFYDDQYAFVKAVARSIPHGVVLAVKPHPLCFPGSSLIKKLNTVPGVQVVSADTDSSEFIKNARAVVSISSTAAYEAGLYGVPAVVFSDMFFCQLHSVVRCRSIEELADAVSAACSVQHDPVAAEAFLAKLFSASYKGWCESPDVYADALSLSNVKDVCCAFEDVVSFYSSKSETAESMCSR